MGGGGGCGPQPMSAAVNITWHGAQINFGDLYLHIEPVVGKMTISVDIPFAYDVTAFLLLLGVSSTLTNVKDIFTDTDFANDKKRKC
jgi:hypothetical protein